MKNLIILIIIIALVVIFLKYTGFWEGKKFEFPKIISERVKQAQESLK